MAKTVSAIFKFQGTIEDLTFVDSRRYKPHVRARKHSKTPFVMTAALAESKARMQQCNQYAKPVFQALRAESHDGGLWSRLVSRLFGELKAGRSLSLECLQGFECNLQHPLGEVITNGYDLSATESQNQLGIYVQLHGHPNVEDKMPRTGYQLRFVAIIPDAETGTVQQMEVLGPLTKYKDELVAHDLKIALPGNDAPYILLMGIVPHMQGEGPARIMSDSGMKVVWVGGRQAVSHELRAASGTQEEITNTAHGTVEVVDLVATDADNVVADVPATSGIQVLEDLAVEEIEKGPEPLVIDAAGDGRQDLTAEVGGKAARQPGPDIRREQRGEDVVVLPDGHLASIERFSTDG